MIDLRSDTLTRPGAGMLTAMMAAPVGDDVYGEDPTVNELERRVAGLFGHEAGLFCPSASMTNLLGIAGLVGAGEEVLCDARAHIARAEMGAHGAITGVTMRTWASPAGIATVPTVLEMLSPDAGPFLVSTAAVALENTHNFGGGTIWPIADIEAISAGCRERGVKVFLDGARIWNAHVATGVSLASYGAAFDAVSVCFSKGLGAPIGAVLVGGAEHIAKARVLRKRLGGGWRQAGVLAAAAGYALDHNIPRLADDHAGAAAFAEQVARRVPDVVEPSGVATNIVVLDTGRRPAAEIAVAARSRGVGVSALGRRMLRAVTHLDVTPAQAAAAGAIVGEILVGR